VKKFRFASKPAFLVVQGTGKFAPPKSAGKKVGQKDSPDFRKETLTTWSNLTKGHRNLSDGREEVESPASKEGITASFWPANFFGPWTWVASLISPHTFGERNEVKGKIGRGAMFHYLDEAQ